MEVPSSGSLPVLAIAFSVSGAVRLSAIRFAVEEDVHAFRYGF